MQFSEFENSDFLILWVFMSEITSTFRFILLEKIYNWYFFNIFNVLIIIIKIYINFFDKKYIAPQYKIYIKIS